MLIVLNIPNFSTRRRGCNSFLSNHGSGNQFQAKTICDITLLIACMHVSQKSISVVTFMLVKGNDWPYGLTIRLGFGLLKIFKGLIA